MEIIIPGEFTNLNKYTAAQRANRYLGAKIKKEETERVMWICKKYRYNKISNHRHCLGFTWYCKDRRTDPDNIAFAKKFILDGLVESGILEDDGWKNIRRFEDHFKISKDNPRVVVSFS